MSSGLIDLSAGAGSPSAPWTALRIRSNRGSNRLTARPPGVARDRAVSDVVVRGAGKGELSPLGRVSAIDRAGAAHAGQPDPILFSVRSERQLMEQMQYNLLFRWFVGLGIDDAVWVATVFTKNRDRLLTTEMSRTFLTAVLAHREVAPLLSDEHFSDEKGRNGPAFEAGNTQMTKLSDTQIITISAAAQRDEGDSYHYPVRSAAPPPPRWWMRCSPAGSSRSALSTASAAACINRLAGAAAQPSFGSA